MAERRMFAKTIIDSDAFLDMPISSRLLYYDLAMRADDDGFVNSPKKIIKFIGATNDDMNILLMRKFIIAFDSGVVVIKHWRIHNYIRKDTYTETAYRQEKGELSIDENKAYTLKNDIRQRAVDEPSTQVSIDKVSIDKDSIRESVEQSSPFPENEIFNNFVQIYNSSCSKLPKVQTLTDKRKHLIHKYLKELTLEQFTNECRIANKSSFLSGKNERKWRADFDFLLRIDKAAGILEGKYSDSEERPKSYDIEKVGKNSVLDWMKKISEE